MAVHSREYERHLGSPEWQARRAARIASTDATCERCGASGRLQLHHRTYDRLGAERDDDLELLCPTCHTDADEDRAEEAADLERTRQIEAYAEARYGHDWRLHADLDQLEDEFTEWSEWADA